VDCLTAVHIYITAEITCVTGAKKTAKEQSKIPWKKNKLKVNTVFIKYIEK
jgi:hypothetical protein